jgi:hypothetical protein
LSFSLSAAGMDRPSTIMLCRVAPGIGVQGHSRFLGFGDELRIAEEGYHDTVRTMARKPYPAIAGMRNVQRLLKTQNPRIADVSMSMILSITASSEN